MFHPHLKGRQHLVLDRRKFLSTATALIAAGVLPKNVLALAAPHSFKQGAYDVTVVSDGTLVLPITIVSPDAKPEELATLLGSMAQGDKVEFQANPVLLKSGNDVILLDNGSGDGFMPTAGKIGDSLKAAGSDAAAITKVIFTHAHPDHCWGTIGADGTPIFPNASLHMAEAEWNFWADPELVSKMPKEMEGFVKGTQAEFASMKEKISFSKPGAEIVPGLNVLDTAGHTPGHVSFEMAGGDGLIITGDAIANPTVFFPHPEWKFGFDADNDAAITKRKQLLEMAASGKKKLLGYHWPYPGIGMAEKKDAAYVYVPAA